MVSPDRPAPGPHGGGAHGSHGGGAPGGGAPGGASSGHAPQGGPAYGGPPNGGLRIGDRERDEVTRLLHDAFAQGRITREELDERLDATLSARTAEDLRRVTADLPGAWPDDPRPAGAHDGGRPAGGPWRPGFPGPGMPGTAPPGMGLPGMGLPGMGSWRHGPPWQGVAPAGGQGPYGGPAQARLHRRHHGPVWGPRPGGGPAPLALAGGVLMVAGMVTGVWPLFVVGRLLLVAWLVMTVVGLIRRRRHRHGMGYR
ncbi:DUF1707 domain-containing protein [Microbispora sp. H11081]|uniref:DUF1707 SHOCT-like domain-containing protein n=1 Tax=Microbispora sp. H11081 TaxID=2729107 RepID=UPI0014727E31|nr:DUF1707 domain-containing protein [Microbispora sp. H11081]